MCAHLLADADWVADHLETPDVRLIDVREPWEYDSIDHLPGAVNVPFERYRDREGPDPGTLPGAAAFGDLLGAAGVDPETTLVAYDDTHGVFAARFVLTALAYGHDDVKLLDGDFTAWRRAHPVTTDEPRIEPTEYPINGLAADAPIVDRAAVEAAIEGGETTILDTREAEEYDAGHLPGAVRVDWFELVDEASRGVKPAADVEGILADRGIDTDRTRPIILYCNTSRRLSHTFVVLRSLGFERVAVYEGSLTDWERAAGRTHTTD